MPRFFEKVTALWERSRNPKEYLTRKITQHQTQITQWQQTHPSRLRQLETGIRDVKLSLAQHAEHMPAPPPEVKLEELSAATAFLQIEERHFFPDEFLHQQRHALNATSHDLLDAARLWREEAYKTEGFQEWNAENNRLHRELYQREYEKYLLTTKQNNADNLQQALNRLTADLTEVEPNPNSRQIQRLLSLCEQIGPQVNAFAPSQYAPEIAQIIAAAQDLKLGIDDASLKNISEQLPDLIQSVNEGLKKIADLEQALNLSSDSLLEKEFLECRTQLETNVDKLNTELKRYEGLVTLSRLENYRQFNEQFQSLYLLIKAQTHYGLMSSYYNNHQLVRLPEGTPEQFEQLGYHRKVYSYDHTGARTEITDNKGNPPTNEDWEKALIEYQRSGKTVHTQSTLSKLWAGFKSASNPNATTVYTFTSPSEKSTFVRILQKVMQDRLQKEEQQKDARGKRDAEFTAEIPLDAGPRLVS